MVSGKMRIHPLYKTKLTEISQILLSLLILSINMNGPDFFRTKEIFFFLFVLVSLPYGNYRRIFDFLLIFSILLFSDVLNLIIPGSDLTPSEAVKNSLGMIYLFILVYNKDEYKQTILKSYLFSSVCVAIFICSIWLVCTFSESAKEFLVAYFSTMKNDKTAFVLKISMKKILKWWVLGVYYGTAPCMIPVLGYCLIYGIKTKRNKFLLVEILLTAALIMSGTRANIMTAVLLDAFYFGFWLLRKKQYTLAMFLITLVAGFGVILAFLFLTTVDASLNVKTLHKMSYEKEFISDYGRFLLYGWGAGSTFYSAGFKSYTGLTELSHLETVRRYGLVPAIMIFVFVWLKPVVTIISKEKSLLKYFYMILLVSYIFVACTNPFLLGSIGFCALLFMSTFFERGFL